MADTDIPKFETYAEGEPIPPVDPEDIKRFWHVKPPWCSGNDVQSACSPGADVAAVFRRWGMIGTLTIHKLLTPWQHGEELDDAVFRIAATLPLHEVTDHSYMIPGDEHFGFDPNAFVQRLVEETGIAHEWEPVATKVGGDVRLYIEADGPQGLDSNTTAKRAARELAWNIWKRFSPSLDQLLVDCDKEQAAHIVATFFADFLMDNMDLIGQIEAGYRTGSGDGGLPVWLELERRAQGRYIIDRT